MGPDNVNSVQSFRFLLSRRWVLFAVVVVVVAYATWWLGEWQFSRLEERREANDVVRTNESRDPAPAAEVMPPDGEVAGEDEWRLVTATGSYLPEHTIVVRYRTRDGAPGIDVVVPLRTRQGTLLLVDRGWLQTDPSGSTSADVPAPPEGRVTVVGWARADAESRGTDVADHSTRAVNSDAVADALGRPEEVHSGFVELRTENGEGADGLERVELPELDDGPHFFYGLQWWFFGLLAVGGFGYLVYAEWRDRARGRTPGAGRR